MSLSRLPIGSRLAFDEASFACSGPHAVPRVKGRGHGPSGQNRHPDQPGSLLTTLPGVVSVCMSCTFLRKVAVPRGH